MKRILLVILLIFAACVPALRVYESGKLVSTKITFGKIPKQPLKYKGVENVFWIVRPSGLLQKPPQTGVQAKDRAPIALTLFCPSGNGTIRTIAIVPHLIVLGPIVWYPAYTKVYCETPTSEPTPTSQPNATKPTAEEEASRFFAQAEIDYKLLKYNNALENYQRAYEKVQSPELLFNIAQCYRLLERYQEAATTYETFLREDPNSAVKAEVEKLLADTKKKLKQQQKNK